MVSAETFTQSAKNEDNKREIIKGSVLVVPENHGLKVNGSA